ncbi:MAG: cadherin-like beta sandwich domain-containing protein [bacterium]|nr:cadherin-like beta sandwich domain-containing protein [bacterium]
MKKIEKKCSKFTKLLIVFGMLFTNLSPLSIVFAESVNSDVTVSVNNGKLNVNYLGDIDDTDEISVVVNENYTYLDNTTDNSQDASMVLLGSDFGTNGVELDSALLSNVIFDGLYEVNVKLYNKTDLEELGEVNFSKNIKHQSGLSYKVYDGTGVTEIIPSIEGKYGVDGEFIVKYKVLAGNISPSDVFKDETTGDFYTASQLLEKEYSIVENKDGNLYGEYNVLFKVALTKSAGEDTEDFVLEDSVNVMYGEYSDNADLLNSSADSLLMNSKYIFSGEDKAGKIFVLPTNQKYLATDILDILDLAYINNDKVNYVISNSEYSDVMNATDEVYVDDETVVTITSGDLTITYKCVMLGDLNNDGIIDNADLKLLVEKIVNETEVNDKTDVYKDDALNTYDAQSMAQVIENNSWDGDVVRMDATFEPRLELVNEDIVSGDTFVVKYVLPIEQYNVSGIAGLVNYDKSLMELVNINVKNDFIGANNNGKFLYLGNSLDSSNSEYVMLELTFKALSSGNGTISVTDNELFNKDTYYNIQDMDVSTQVVINTSADNKLSSLKVAGQEIQLKSDVLEYRISVDNDVVTPNVEAITNNVAAKVTSIEAPEELVEGDNIIKVKVTAENGDELVYTIIVNRKAKESNDNNNSTKPVSYQNDNNVAEDTQEDINLPAIDDKKNDAIKDNKKDDEKKDNNTSRIIIIILILLVIAGLIYLIFKDDEEDDDIKKANKDINKLKKDNIKASTSKSNIKKSKK